MIFSWSPLECAPRGIHPVEDFPLRITNIVIAVAFGAATVAAWAYANRPTPEPHWPSRVQGFAFSPYRAGQDPGQGDFPSVAHIDSDLALLEEKPTQYAATATAGTLGRSRNWLPAMASMSLLAPGLTAISIIMRLRFHVLLTLRTTIATSSG